MLEIFAAISTPECAQVAVPEATEQALRYYQSGNILWIVQQAWSLIVPLLFLLWGLTGKMSTLAARWGRNWYFTIIVYLILFIAISQLLNFPLDFYSDYIRQHQYGLSTQTLSRWFDNYGKSALVAIIIAAAFIWIFYLFLKKSPRRWWFYGSLASIGIMFIMMVVQPIWIDPLFNQFGPMKNKKLERQILNLASRAGIAQGRVFEVDKSQDTKMLNAYVIGFGATNRIVLWDTTIQQLTPDEILFVMGHEMGHYVMHHLWWNLGYSAALSFLVFYLTYRSANFLLKKYHHRFGFNSLANIASLPLLLLLINIFMLLSSPISNCFSRYFEHEADRFGLEITQDNKAAAEAFIALQQENLAIPRPGLLFKIWRSSHPPLGERIDFCNSYCPWKREEPLKYTEYFQK
jgi:STE24 endopeptidase